MGKMALKCDYLLNTCYDNALFEQKCVTLWHQ